MYNDGGEQLTIKQVDAITQLNEKTQMPTYKDIDFSSADNMYVVLSNILLENMPDLSLNASKLFDSIVASLPSFPDEETEALKIMERERFRKIVVTDIVANWGSLDRRVAYDTIKQTLAELNSKPFSFEYIDKSGKRTVFSSVVIASYKYIDKMGYAQVELSSSFAPYLLALRRNFTKWSLQTSYEFSSANAKRLYELLVQYRSVGTRTFTVPDFKAKLHISNKYKGNNYNLKKKVVEASVEEINNNPKGDIIVSYTMEGRGDNATITFKFQKKPKANQKKIEKGRGPVSKDSISSVKLVMKDDLSLGELFSDDVIEELATFALREFQGNSYASVKAMMALGRAKESYDKMINKGTEIKHPRNYFETILQSKCDELQDEEEKEANA